MAQEEEINENDPRLLYRVSLGQVADAVESLLNRFGGIQALLDQYGSSELIKIVVSEVNEMIRDKKLDRVTRLNQLLVKAGQFDELLAEQVLRAIEFRMRNSGEPLIVSTPAFADSKRTVVTVAHPEIQTTQKGQFLMAIKTDQPRVPSEEQLARLITALAELKITDKALPLSFFRSQKDLMLALGQALNTSGHKARTPLRKQDLEAMIKTTTDYLQEQNTPTANMTPQLREMGLQTAKPEEVMMTMLAEIARVSRMLEDLQKDHLASFEKQLELLIARPSPNTGDIASAVRVELKLGAVLDTKLNWLLTQLNQALMKPEVIDALAAAILNKIAVERQDQSSAPPTRSRPLTCPKCNASNSADTKFCTKCGTALKGNGNT